MAFKHSHSLFEISHTASFIPAIFLLFLLLRPSSVAALTIPKSDNVTIETPEGSRFVDNEHLLCTPSTWKTITTFFLANYFAHAATVKSLPGQTAATGLVMALFALLLPTSGMLMGIDAIYQHAVFSGRPLDTVSRSGALCVVVRTSFWRPKDGDVVKGVRRNGIIPKPQKRCPDESGDSVTHEEKGAVKSTQTLPVPVADELREADIPTVGLETLKPLKVVSFFPAISEWSLANRKVHGICCLPPGYALAILPKGAKVDSFHHPLVGDGEADKTKNMDRSTAWWLERVLPLHPFRQIRRRDPSSKLHQETWSSNDINSTYSLSKGLIALFQTVYASSVLLGTRGDQIERYGYAAFGLTVTPYVVMSIVNLVGSITTPEYRAVYMVRNYVMDEAAKRMGGRFEGMVGYLDDVHGEDTVEVLFKVDQTGKTSLRELSGPQSKIQDWQAVSHQPVLNIAEAQKHPPSFALPGRPAVGNELSDIGPARYKVLGYSLLVALVTIGVVGSLSHFQPGSTSTAAQRVWTMLWSSVGIFMGTLGHMGMIGWDVDEGSQPTIATVILPFYGVPAIGGFVVVGQMLKTFGDCKSMY
jgi:hypothetical protein